MIGNLNHPLTLQTPQRTPDGGGGFETTWQDGADIFARIDSVETEEIPERGGRVTRQRCRLTIHHRADLTPGQRFSDGTRGYDILSLRDPDGRGVYLEILAEVT
jgi:SPP1 family predicted phage head-tail adaptor